MIYFVFSAISDSEEEDDQPGRTARRKTPSGTKKPVAKIIDSGADDVDVEGDDDDIDDGGEMRAGAAGKAEAKKTDSKHPNSASNPPPTAPSTSASGDTTKRHQWTYDESVNIWKGVQVYIS